ncbi:glycerol transporter [Rhizina undulata]
MLLFSAFRSIFSLDTLETRCTANTARSSAPPKHSTAPSIAGSSTDESARSKRVRETAEPSKWNTIEFYGYYVVFAVAIPLMFKSAYDVSKESNPNYKVYSHLLSPGWIPGRLVDNSDDQFSTFRDHIPILLLVLGLHSILRRGFDVAYNLAFPPPPVNSRYRPSHNVTRRTIFDVIFALMLLSVLHSFSVIKIMVILIVNFSISYFHPGSILNPILTWTFNIGILFANEYFQGYAFRHLLPWLIAGEGGGVGNFMDTFLDGGIVPRWEISFNISVLRLISYNLDLYWAAKRLEEGDGEEGRVLEVGPVQRGEGDGTTMVADEESAWARENQQLISENNKKKLRDPANLSERDRIDMPAPMEDYGLLTYLAYTMYSPLYLAGPILTFNDFVYQMRYPSAAVTTARTIKYAIRFVISVLVMEVVLHYIYVVAISKTASLGSWIGDTPAQLAMIGYFNLHIIWLKLLIPWRFFRLWSLVDHIDPPENMLRCMSNNYSATAFWRAWHRSFNRWIVRYIYIPLGGSRRPLLNSLAVFTFVALWHDLSLRLLYWGWMVVIFIAPEMIARKVFSRKKFEGRETLYRHLCAVGATANILPMMAANLIGFAIGVDGMKDLVQGVVGSYEGLFFMITACACIFVAAHIMFEIREHEKRKGVDLKC